MSSTEEHSKETHAVQDTSNKRQRIFQACVDRDTNKLRKLATSEGGLLDDELRRTAWPILLGCEQGDRSAERDSKDLAQHRDEGQVQLDVDRSFVYYPEADSETKKDARKAELSRLIVTVLRQHPMLHYFQGYHDIVQVLLLVLGVDEAVPAVARLSLLRIRDFMLPSMAGTEPHLRLLPMILVATDPILASHLSQTQPFFALAATLTLYAHEIEEYGSIARLFDFLLASEAVLPVYLFAATVLSRKDKLLEIEADEPEMLHSVLSKLPRPLNLESLIGQAVELFQRHPPERLPGRVWSRISSYSVLKTTRNFDDLPQQTLQDGERFLELEAAEIRREEARIARNRHLRALGRRYQRPIRYTGVAVLAAIIAMLARSHTSPFPISSWNAVLAGLQNRISDMWQRFTV